MSIFQDFEKIKNEIGYKKYNMIEKYLETKCNKKDINNYFKEMNKIWDSPPEQWNNVSNRLKEKYNVVLLDDVLYKEDEWIKFDNWYNNSILKRKVKILDFWQRDFGDIGVNAVLIENDSEVAKIMESFDKEFVVCDNTDKCKSFDETINKSKIENEIYKSFDYFLGLPKLSHCTKLLQGIYDDLCASENEMYYVDYLDWNEYYQEEYSRNDINKLNDEVEKYNLQTVLEVDNGEYMILGYGDLPCNFNDDRELNKSKELLKNIISEEDLNYISERRDFNILQENLDNKELIKINNILYDFLEYQSKYDDGKKDIISEYISKYGNSNIIDWYEGIKDTETFIKDFILEERNKEYEI